MKPLISNTNFDIDPGLSFVFVLCQTEAMS